jgi:hypothetical protein
MLPLWQKDGSVIFSAITHRLESRRTHNHILLTHLRLPPTWRARSPYLYPPGTGWPSYTAGHWVPFLSPLMTLKATGFPSSSYIMTNSRLASSSWCPWPDFNFLCLTINFFFLHVRYPLWQENGSVICSAILHWLNSHRTHNHILLSHLRHPQLGGPGPRTHIPHEQHGPAQSKKSESHYDWRFYGVRGAAFKRNVIRH